MSIIDVFCASIHVVMAFFLVRLNVGYFAGQLCSEDDRNVRSRQLEWVTLVRIIL